MKLSLQNSYTDIAAHAWKFMQIILNFPVQNNKVEVTVFDCILST